MLPTNYWQKELMEDWRGKKSRIMKFIFPLVLLAPVILSSAPFSVKADLIGLMVLFIGVFGAAVGLIRIRENKMLERMAVLPINPREFLLEYILAKSIFVAAQLFPPLLLFIILNPSLFVALLPIIFFYFMATFTASAIGVLVAIISGSSGEVHLIAALIVIGVAGLSGFFMNSNLSIMMKIGYYSPFRVLSLILFNGVAFIFQYFPYLSLITFVIIFLLIILVSNRIFTFD